MEGTKATRDDLESLKANWIQDPCWDIEQTEGFEDFAEELLKYRLEVEEGWKVAQAELLQRESERLGIPGDHNAAQEHGLLDKAVRVAQDQLDEWDNSGHEPNGRTGLYRVINELIYICQSQNRTILRLEQKINSLLERIDEVDDEMALRESMSIWSKK